jgi:N-acyl-D-amino-acid deacylase
MPAPVPPTYDLVLRGGTIYDGGGGPPVLGDVAIDGDRIAAVGRLGDLAGARGRRELDVAGLAVAPGFVNMLSWADESLLVDGRSLSDLVQGVTLEVFGEGWSMGPLDDAMRDELIERQQELVYDVPWTTLGEYLEHLERRGVATNVASFVGAETVRIHELGYENRPPTADELGRMRELVRVAMEEGALGLGSSLPYAPADFASTAELIALAEVAARYDGLYISHVRDEGTRIHEALDEFLEIVRAAGIRGEVYHLKASGRENWSKLEEVIARLEAARAEGLAVTADIYPYHASSTGLSINFPTWVQEGGHEAFVERLRDPAIRERLRQPGEMRLIPPEDILLVGFRNEELRRHVGRTLADVAAERGADPIDTAMDLIVEDDSRIGTVRFTMSEENVRRKIALPWVSFCSDSGSMAPEEPFLALHPHPRAYGSFARVLGKYVREEKLVPLEEAIRRLTSLPAENLKLDRRGRLAPGFFADVVVFDPATIADRATFEEPHRLAIGVEHVFVNGGQVIAGGEHTGATPGRVVRGPGWSGRGEETP